MNEAKIAATTTQLYTSALREVTEVFESCGCSTEVVCPSASEAVLIIKGCVSFCPASIFEEHVEKAKELMQALHPNVEFRVEVVETDVCGGGTSS